MLAHIRPDSPSLATWRTRFAAMGPSVSVDSTPLETAALGACLLALAPTALVLVHGTTRARMKALGHDSAQASYEAVDFGLTYTFCQAAKASGLPIRLVYLSAIGADPQAANPYLRARGKAEDALKNSGLPYAILRPAIISGPDRAEKRCGERLGAQLFDGLLNTAARLGLSTLKQNYASIDAPTLAPLLIALADGQAEGTLNLGTLRGGDTSPFFP